MVRGRNLSTRCSSSDAMGRWVFTGVSPGTSWSYLARSRRVSQKMLAWHGCDYLSLQSLMEPAVIDSKPTIFRDAENIGVAVPKTNVGMIVGFSCVDGLRRNNVISGHHHN